MNKQLNVACVGCTDTGKTTLLRRLAHELSMAESKVETREVAEAPLSPTVGVDILNVTAATSSGKVDITLREAGGAIKKMWPGHIMRADCILFLIDSASPWQLALSASEFHKVLSSTEDHKKPIFLVFNKVDMLPQRGIPGLAGFVANASFAGSGRGARETAAAQVTSPLLDCTGHGVAELASSVVGACPLTSSSSNPSSASITSSLSTLSASLPLTASDIDIVLQLDEISPHYVVHVHQVAAADGTGVRDLASNIVRVMLRAAIT